MCRLRRRRLAALLRCGDLTGLRFLRTEKQVARMSNGVQCGHGCAFTGGFLDCLAGRYRLRHGRFDSCWAVAFLAGVMSAVASGVDESSAIIAGCSATGSSPGNVGNKAPRPLPSRDFDAITCSSSHQWCQGLVANAVRFPKLLHHTIWHLCHEDHRQSPIGRNSALRRS